MPIHVEGYEFQCQKASRHKEMEEEAPLKGAGVDGKLLLKRPSIRLGGELRAPLTLCYRCTETVHLRHPLRPAGTPATNILRVCI